MASQGRSAGRLEAGGPAPGHEHPLGLSHPVERLERHLGLLAGRGVDHTAHLSGHHEAGHTAHRRADARPYLALPTIAGLGYQLGVGDHPPHDGHQIGHTALDQVLGVVKGGDAAGDDGGHIHRLGDHLAGGHLVAQSLVQRGQQPMEPPVRRQRHIQEVDVGLHQFGDGGSFLRLDPALDLVVGGDADPDGEAGAGLGSDGGQNLPQEPGAVLQTAPVVVVSQVGGRGEELADQVAVSAVELYPVESALFAPTGRGGERLHQLVDHGLGQLLGDYPHHRAGDGAGGQGLLEVLKRPLLDGRAPVPKLLEDLAAGGVQAGGHLLVEREHFVGEHGDVGGR